jgi:glutaredoxin
MDLMLDSTNSNPPQNKNQKVTMYCTPWCPDCVLARIWLKEHGVAYTEVDISSDLDAARQVRSWGKGAQVTPTFDIDGQIILDFDEKELENRLRPVKRP